MKRIILALGLMSTSIYGVTLTTNYTNFQGAGAKDTNVVFSDNTGNVLGANAGFLALGTFAITNAEIALLSTAGAMDSAFATFGTPSTLGTTAGTFSTTTSGDPDTLFDGVNSFTGGNVYVIIGNGASLATSNEFLVWDSGIVFDNSDPSGSPSNIVLDAGSGSLVVGRDDKDTFDMSGFGGSANEIAFTTVALVPEPSSIALLGLGLVGFTLRRRR